MLLIGEGTADIQRMIIGRRLLESCKRALRAGTAMDSNLSVSVADGVARLTFQRPEKRNAITAGMWSGISEILQSLVGRDDVRCLAVQGSGGCFSAGADLAAVRDASGSPSSAYQALVERGLRSIREFRWPTLAVIEGPCIGGGCAIALACDVRFAVPGATFTIPAVRYGLELEGAALVRLVELVGSGQASRFLLSAMTIRGAEAAAMGLVDLCANNAFAAADEFLDSVAAADPATVAKTVAAIRMAARTPVGALEAVNPVS
jgi:enoyl-CoA hydratase/carnithine racemase